MNSLADLDSETRRLLKDKQSMAALRLAEKAASLHPKNAAAQNLLGDVLWDVGRFEEALVVYQLVVQLGGHGEAAERAAHLLKALKRPPRPLVPTHRRSWFSGLPGEPLDSIQNALHNYSYKGTPMLKNPFDHALYPLLLSKLKPRTLIEIGSKEGGSALWFGDLCDTLGLDCKIHSIDIVRVATVKHKRVTFHEADGRNLASYLTDKFLAKLPRPWLVIEDADHSYETSMAVLNFFEDKLQLGDMLVMEDGIITDLSRLPEGASGPHRALRKFLQRNYAEYEIASEWCDYFGYNFTWSSNGFLRRTGLKKLGPDVAPDLVSSIDRVKKKQFAEVLAELTGQTQRGARYLSAYCLWRLERLPEACAAVADEVAAYPDHRQAHALHDLLYTRLHGTTMTGDLPPQPRLPASQTLHMVNLGCGRRYDPAWLNFDVVPVDESVRAHDLQQPLPLADGTCSVVYHSHVLEHLPKDKAPAFLAECFRVLAPGGILRIAVPDLESIARLYLETLTKAAAGDEVAAQQHEWMTLELVDQLARHRSGGHMLDYWKQQPMPAEDFVLQRVGREAGDFIAEFRAKPAPSVKIAAPTADAVGRFRTGGEPHQWMYDRVSLTRLLKAAGFTQVRVCTGTESAIPNFASYHLDTDESGAVRKPDSIFVEAIK